jgi:hypothetical protein
VAILNIIGNTNASVGGPVSASQGQPVQFTATGGIKTNFQSGSFVYTSHTFTSSGTFVINDGQILGTALLVGGGGGGRSGSVAGVGGEGGGAGGYLIQQNVFFNTASIQIPYVTSSFAITVGAGGAQNNSGSNSILSGSIDYDSKPPVLIAYGGGAGSGSGASGGGEAFTNQPTQGNNGGFRYPATSPNNVFTSSRYSAPAGGAYAQTGSQETYGGHKYWRMITVSGSSPILATVYFSIDFVGSGSESELGNIQTVWTVPPAPFNGPGQYIFPIPNCADYPGTCWTNRNTENNCGLTCGTSLDSGSNGESGSYAIEYTNAVPVRVNNVFFRAPYLSGTNNNCSGSAQGGTNKVILQYKDNATDAWVNKLSGSLIASSEYWLPLGSYNCPGGGTDPDRKSGTFQMASQSFYEGGNIAGFAGQSTSNTLIDGTEKYYSGGGGGGAWSGVLSGSAYITDENATGAVNAGIGGESGSINGTNAVANSGCGGGGGAVNDSASLRGTGGSGGSGIVVITYISGSAI